MDPQCLFCKIAAKQIPAKVAFENGHCFAFHDINPQAPVHILIVPRQHIATVNDATPANAAVLGHLFAAARDIAAAHGLGDRGYRLVINTNQDAGQTVFHLHVHLLGGRAMGWPPFPA